MKKEHSTFPEKKLMESLIKNSIYEETSPDGTNSRMGEISNGLPLKKR